MKTQIKPNTIIAGNALSVLKTLPDNCIDCVMTSPPYWTLRDYGAGAVAIWNNISGCRHRWVKFESQAARHARNSLVQQRSKRAARKRQGSHQSAVCSTCSAWKGQLGLEPTFELYIQHLCAVFDEIRRVLKSSGTCWVNLGDTYAGSWGAASHSRNKAKRTGTNQRPPSSFAQSVSRKSLCLIPFRFAIEMMNRNWILRNVIIWQKPNCLPSSVSDRFTVDFEYLLFFSKTREYYFEPQFEPHHSSTIKRVRRFMLNNEQFDPTRHKCDPETGVCPVSILRNIAKNGLCPAGRNKRCVWSIPTQPFLEPHFATFPEALCDVPIRSSCPLFVCGHCGKPFRRMTELNRKSLATQSPRAEVAAHSAKRSHIEKATIDKIDSCNAKESNHNRRTNRIVIKYQ